MYRTLEDLNGTGIVGIFQANAEATIWFPIMIVVSIWAIIGLGSFYASIRRHNRAEFLASLTVGGCVASVIAGILMIIPDVMPLRIVVITIILEIIFVILFFSDKNLKDQ